MSDQPSNIRPRQASAWLALACVSLLLLACATSSEGPPPGFAAVPRVDLPRFMGDWHVVAHIPTRTERNASGAIERYTLREDGEIDVLFRFCDLGDEGDRPEPRELRMRGWVVDEETNAEWRVRPFWPLRLRYQILELSDDYATTVVGHPSGSYAWIMAREPRIAPETLTEITRRLEVAGYDVGRLRRVPAGDCAA